MLLEELRVGSGLGRLLVLDLLGGPDLLVIQSSDTRTAPGVSVRMGDIVKKSASAAEGVGLGSSDQDGEKESEELHVCIDRQRRVVVR